MRKQGVISPHIAGEGGTPERRDRIDPSERVACER